METNNWTRFALCTALVSTLVSTVACTSRAATTATGTSAAAPDPLRLRNVYTIPNMDKAKVQKDIVYETVHNQKLDIYSPSTIASGTKLPVVFLVHGEMVLDDMKSIGQYESAGQLVAASGVIAVTFNHRVLYGGASLDDISSDITNAIAYIRQNADKYNVDKDRVAIWSFSGGVTNGLYAGLNNSLEYVKCLVLYYGPADASNLVKLLTELAPGATLTPGDNVNTYSATNLLDKYAGKVPPIFIERSGLDFPTLLTSEDAFIASAIRNNVQLEIYTNPAEHHGFEVNDNTDRARETVQATLEFLKKHLL